MKMGTEFWAAHVATVKLEAISASNNCNNWGRTTDKKPEIFLSPPKHNHCNFPLFGIACKHVLQCCHAFYISLDRLG